MDESEKDREERVVRLWTTLAATPDGHLDIRSFKKGLKRIDHRALPSTRYNTGLLLTIGSSKIR